MRPLDKELSLSAKVHGDLILRSYNGAWGHPIVAALILLTTNLNRREPVTFWTFAVCLVLASALRLLVLRSCNRAGPEVTPGCLQLHVFLIMVPSAIWGIMPGISLWRFGYQDTDVLIFLLYHAAISFATANLLVHSQRLIAISLGLLCVPAIVGSLLHVGPHPFSYLAAASVYLLYCFVQGRKLHTMYSGHISDNYDLSVAAYVDCLTGLPNRLYMNEALESCFAEGRTNARQVALLYVDLDGFKQINDRHSHKVGDMVLREVATRLHQTLRKTDLAARIGGDEFTILLPENASQEEAFAIANRVLLAARLPVHINEDHLCFSASIGISLFPATASNLDTLMQTADEAMYLAKASGKDRICMMLADGNRQITAV